MYFKKASKGKFEKHLWLYDPEKIISCIEAIETPSISEAEIESPTKEIREYSNEAKIQIADIAGAENLKISLLLGSDFC